MAPIGTTPRPAAARLRVGRIPPPGHARRPSRSLSVRGHPAAFIGTSRKQIDHPKGVITPVIDSKAQHMESWWPDWHLLWPRSRAMDLRYGRRPGCYVNHEYERGVTEKKSARGHSAPA